MNILGNEYINFLFGGCGMVFISILREQLSKKKQSAAFVYKIENEDIKVLLVKTSGRRWTFPKGKNKKNKKNYEVACKNALEEGGIKGNIQYKPFCTYKHYKQELKNTGMECSVKIFLLEMIEQISPIENFRDPTWFKLEDALEALQEGRHPLYKREYEKVIKKANKIIKKKI